MSYSSSSGNGPMGPGDDTRLTIRRFGVATGDEGGGGDDGGRGENAFSRCNVYER